MPSPAVLGAPTDTHVHAYVRAAGGTGAAAVDLLEYVNGRQPALDADAKPVMLRTIVAQWAPRVSRMASRFAQLAALGAANCLRQLGRAPDPTTRVYLGTGLGDVAATDALYYAVMPPTSEAPSPARFATSGNNMAAFFVAQHAQLTSRNLTVSQAGLSFECALDLALSDLSAGAAATALVGGVDETTLPREFYTRRFAVAPDQPIGEGSGWLLLDSQRNHEPPVCGAISAVRLLPPPRSDDGTQWIDQVMSVIQNDPAWAHLAHSHEAEDAAPIILVAGCGVETSQLAALAARFTACEHHSYLPYTGRFPTASALGIAALLTRQWPRNRTCLHVNRDASGRTGLVAFELYGRSA